jgi:hypothetical protein
MNKIKILNEEYLYTENDNFFVYFNKYIIDFPISTDFVINYNHYLITRRGDYNEKLLSYIEKNAYKYRNHRFSI